MLSNVSKTSLFAYAIQLLTRATRPRVHTYFLSMHSWTQFGPSPKTHKFPDFYTASESHSPNTAIGSGELAFRQKLSKSQLAFQPHLNVA